ncbi:MAG: hypothetical protein GY768_16065 [Planctomycetaceae bacterium]|nr:hypothetical protein [Planctomycetaceae bacterium]
MMLERLSLYLNRTQIASIVDRVVIRSHHAVWQRVRERAWSMTPYEARGYIRARAALVVEREMSIVLAELNDFPSVHAPLVAAAVSERLVDRTLGDVSRMRRATEPLRRAA